MKILAFGASSSSQSVNKKLATYAASLIDSSETEVIDLNDYEAPIYSEDLEKASGQPDVAKKLLQKLGEADAIIVSFAEHNGSYTAAYKNIFDWMSRIQRDVFQNKPIVMLATSPGPSGGKNVLAQATGAAPHFAAKLVGQMSIPKFYETFDLEANELKDEKLREELTSTVSALTA